MTLKLSEVYGDVLHEDVSLIDDMLRSYVLKSHPNLDTLECPLDSVTSNVDHPSHYGSADDPYEAIKVIEAWNLGFNLGNTVKYISRAGKKDGNPTVQDLEKARWYLDREIGRLKNGTISRTDK